MNEVSNALISATKYEVQNKKLMLAYEQRVRSWMRKEGEVDIADKIPFFRDGVTCPGKWFQEGNDFRPLFVLKEVSLGIDRLTELDDYLKEWGYQHYFEFATNPYDDIRIGRFPTWIRIARLAKGLEEIHMGADNCDYYKHNLSFKSGGEKYTGYINGYKTSNYLYRTASEEYLDIIDRIAVINLKKVGGGKNVESEISEATMPYTKHIGPFADLLCSQIKLINPTIVVCCGREKSACFSKLLNDIKATSGERIWIDGYHPAYSSNERFFYSPLNVYKSALE